MRISYTLIPIVGGIIGWITNLLAIKLLFRPLQPMKLGPFVIHGLIPRRKIEIAEALAHTVATDLVDLKALMSQVSTSDVRDEISATIMRIVVDRGKDRIPPFIPEAFKVMLLDFVQKIVGEELATNLPRLMDDLTDTLVTKIDIKVLVRQRIEAMDLEQLEGIILKLANRELKAIEYLGGVLGFLIGLLQLGVVLVTK